MNTQRWQDCIYYLKVLYSRLCEDRITLAAGAIAFFTLLSLVPLLLLAVTFAAPQLNELLDGLQPTLGPFYGLLKEQTHYLSDPGTRIISIPAALVFGVWSGSQIFLILESAMNLAWHARKKRPFWLRRLLAFCMVFVVVLLMFGAMLLVNLVRFLAGLDITIWGHNVGQWSWLLRATLTVIIPVTIISALFMVIFRVLPAKRVTLRSVIPGALISGVLWLVALHLVSYYWYYFGAAKRYNLVYGSLTGIFLLMILLYYGALILLLGSEISAAYHQCLMDAGNRSERLAEETDVTELPPPRERVALTGSTNNLL